MLLGVIRPHVSPAGTGLSDRDTEPEKPLTDVRVRVDIIRLPTSPGAGGLAVMPKSGRGATVTMMVAFRMSCPLVPVTLTEYVPGETLPATVTLSWDVCTVVTAVGLGTAVIPLTEEAISATVPAKPPIDMTPIVEIADDPAVICKVEGVEVREKSGVPTFTSMITSWTRRPLEPSTSTV